MDRSQYEHQWTFYPVRTLPGNAPQPWFVCGYSFKAVNNVLRVDYLAVRRNSGRSEYELPGGKVTYIGHPEELRGTPVGSGTLFVLWGDGGNLDRIIDEASRRGIAYQSLPFGVPT